MGHKNDTNDTFKAQEPLAETLTKEFGTRECKKFRADIFEQHIELSVPLAVKYAQTAKNYDYIRANQELLQLNSLLIIHDLNLSWDKDQINAFCVHAASSCSRLIATYPEKIAKLRCRAFINEYNIELPLLEKLKACDLNRFKSSQWWKKKIFVLSRRAIETVRRNLNIVRSKNQIYSSDYTVQLRQHQKDRTRKYLESTFIRNDTGQEFSLLDISSRTVSNPIVRRSELMTRISGFEQVAELLGDEGTFATINTPSRMHATIKNTGKQNPRFDGTNPRQANKYLCHVWALIRSELNRRGIYPYGFRITEPHHDGTPHWHLLMFVAPKHKTSLEEVIRHYSLLDSPNEKGAQKARVKLVDIDPSKGSAAGYIAKYVSKNIDGYGIDEDLEGNNSITSAKRIEAWASLWGIRQFQQVGGASVTIWRELRKLDASENKDLELFRHAADSGDWAAYTLLMNGPISKRKDRALQTWYEKKECIDYSTGEIISAPLTLYGEEAPEKLVGIKLAGLPIKTRNRLWTLVDSSNEEQFINHSSYQSHAPP